VDREVAARDDFQYSPAMRAFGGEWTTERLDAFLANPQATVPGTTMQMPGIRDAAERAAIVNYLKAFAR
jgi:cytochrome c